MSARQIDEALLLWRDRLNAAAQNLIDLQAHPVYKRISDPDAQLTGDTAEKSALAVRTLSWLLQYFDSLQGVISRAEELRDTMPSIFGAEEREREIASLLNGRSVQLPAVQIPFGQRSLLGGIQDVSSVSPAELLRVMESAFEQCKQIVLELDAAWESLGQSIEDATHRLTALRELAGHLDADDRSALALAGEKLRRLQEAATQDPLGTASQFITGVTTTLDRISGKLDERRRVQAQVRAEMASAQQVLESLRTEHRLAVAACAEAREKTACAAVVGDERVSALESWFARLQQAFADGGNGAVAVGLRNWTVAARQTLQAEQETLGEARRQLGLRSELRGRLDALKAKARAYGVAELDDLAGIADRAKALLYQRPTPLQEAAAMVSEYESKLNFEAAKNVRK